MFPKSQLERLARDNRFIENLGFWMRLAKPARPAELMLTLVRHLPQH
jgi:hypothetical protein